VCALASAAPEGERLAPPWRNPEITNDGVMGGVSTSRVDVSGPRMSGTMTFEGDVSFDNNGGFASMRLADDPRDLSAYDGLLLTYNAPPEGEPRAINVQIYSRQMQFGFGGMRPRSFSAAFVVVPGVEGNSTWYLPFDRFRGTNGFTMPDTRARFDPSSFLTMGFQVSFQKGAFNVSLQSVDAVKMSNNATCVPAQLESACALMDDAADRASSVVSKGDYGAGPLYPGAGAAFLQYAIACAPTSSALEAAAAAGEDASDLAVLRRVYEAGTTSSDDGTSSAPSPAALAWLFGCAAAA